MKKFLPIFLGIILIGLFYFNSSSIISEQSPPSIEEIKIKKDGTIMKNDFREALMEFGDEDDTLDSLDYVPEFLIR